MLNLRSYIYFFFAFLPESFSTVSLSKVKDFENSILSADTLVCLNLIKGEIGECSGQALAFTLSCIWLTLFSALLAFFYTTLGLILVVFFLAGFVFYLEKWRNLNGLYDFCFDKKNELESQGH